jgi:hypothetical protein
LSRERDPWHPAIDSREAEGRGDCWHGGGLFTARSTYWLNDGYGHSVLRNTGEVRRDTNFQQSERFGGECLGVYYFRGMAFEPIEAPY